MSVQLIRAKIQNSLLHIVYSTYYRKSPVCLFDKRMKNIMHYTVRKQYILYIEIDRDTIRYRNEHKQSYRHRQSFS